MDEIESGQAPAVETPTPPETPAPTPPPSPVEDQAPEGDEDDDADGDATLTPDEYEKELARIRRQAARFRTERRTAREENQTLAARIAELEAATQAPAVDPAQAAVARAEAAERELLRIKAASTAGIPLSLLEALDALQGAPSADAMTQALSTVTATLSGLSRSPRIPTPPTTPAHPETIDDQIRAAESSGNVMESLRLKSAKLAALTLSHR